MNDVQRLINRTTGVSRRGAATRVGRGLRTTMRRVSRGGMGGSLTWTM